MVGVVARVPCVVLGGESADVVSDVVDSNGNCLDARYVFPDAEGLCADRLREC